MKLDQEYQQCFQQTKKKLEEHPEEKPFDFSEMYIFGKFNNFSRRWDTWVYNYMYVSDYLLFFRLQKIVEFLKTVGTYETLSLSRIEGIDTFNSRFNLLVTGLKKKPYDILEHRKNDFDVDYEDFKIQLQELDVSYRGNKTKNGKTLIL